MMSPLWCHEADIFSLTSVISSQSMKIVLISLSVGNFLQPFHPVWWSPTLYWCSASSFTTAISCYAVSASICFTLIWHFRFSLCTHSHTHLSYRELRGGAGSLLWSDSYKLLTDRRNMIWAWIKCGWNEGKGEGMVWNFPANKTFASKIYIISIPTAPSLLLCFSLLSTTHCPCWSLLPSLPL